MPEEPHLRAATPDEIDDTLAFALRFEGRRRVHHVDDVMARITAERLVKHLERSGFVVMKKPPLADPRVPDGCGSRVAAAAYFPTRCCAAIQVFVPHVPARQWEPCRRGWPPRPRSKRVRCACVSRRSFKGSKPMRLIPTRVHGLVDYFWGTALLLAPRLLSFPAGSPEAITVRATGAGAIAYAALTDYELGLVPALTMRQHLALDLAGGAALAASPWLLAFSGRTRSLHLIFGSSPWRRASLTRTRPGHGAALRRAAPRLGVSAAASCSRSRERFSKAVHFRPQVPPHPQHLGRRVHGASAGGGRPCHVERSGHGGARAGAVP